MKYLKTFEKYCIPYEQWREMIFYINDIMIIIRNVECNIKCECLTIKNAVYSSDGKIYVNTNDMFKGKLGLNFTDMCDDGVEKLYNYLKENYDYVLSGKDMGLF